MDKHSTEKMSEKPETAIEEFLPQQEGPLKVGLYLVATPIGNLRDISFRALDTLRRADLILCEDTRVTRKLLSAYQVKTKTQSYHDHSEEAMRAKIADWIKQGQSIALASDAGMPLISDPGYKLVQSCREQGIYITTIPGANAPLSALQLSGLPSDKFCFLGFLPNKTKARQDLLREWINTPATLLAFETAPRLIDALEDIQTVMGDREVAVVREITKLFEETRRGTPQDLLNHYQEKGLPKGEIVLVIAPPVPQDFSENDLADMIRTALKTMKTKDAASFVAENTGKTKSELYKIALEINKND